MIGKVSQPGFYLDILEEIRYFCVIMMKKVLSLALMAMALTALSAQDLTFSKGKTHEFTITPSGPDDCPIYITNNTGKPMVIAYEKISADYNPGWIISFCDNVNCYSDFVTSDTFTTITANETVNIKVSVMSMGKADTAVVKYAVWNKYGNNIVKDTLSWTIFMPESATVNSTSMVMNAVYPNPTGDYVMLPALAKNVEVFDAKGRKINRIEFANGKLNLLSEAVGVYTVRFEVGGLITSQTVIRK